jgi:hypothetical protein
MRAGLVKNFSLQDAPFHYLTAAVTSDIPLRITYLPVPNSYLDAMASFYKITVPYMVYRVVEKVCMKYNCIEHCYFYAESSYIYITKMTICVFSYTVIKYNVLLVLFNSMV